VREDGDISRVGDRALVEALTSLAAAAADAVQRIAGGSVGVRSKADRSPVTDADHASEAVILEGLARILPSVRVVSEESRASPVAIAPDAVFVLVDPLDGTREFIAGRDEFTINIAVIAAGTPVIGVLAAPARGMLWRGIRGIGAERLPLANGAVGEPVGIRARPWPTERPRALVSRSHLDASSIALLDAIAGAVREPCGSALKFCRLAEGGADFYPRLAPTSEWDAAAGHALLAAAGGTVLTPAGVPVRYGNGADGFRLPAFMALADPAAAALLLPAGGAGAASR
jgi:3'(2'), 5'-bisphosphate nucleotidase